MPINGEKSVLTCREEQQFVSFCKRKLFSEKFYHIKKPTIIQGSKYNEMVPVHDIKLNFIN